MLSRVIRRPVRLHVPFMRTYAEPARYKKVQPQPPQADASSEINARIVTTLLLVGIAGTVGFIAATKKNEFNPPPNVYPGSSTTKVEDLARPFYCDSMTMMQVVKQIRRVVGDDHVSTSKDELDSHSDNSYTFHRAQPLERPVAVVYPANAEEVQEIVKICYKYRVPMVPVSGATSIEGHFIPTRRGVCIDLGRMNQIVALHEDDMDVVVQAGVDWQELGEYLQPHGLMFGPDPGPGAKIGGMVATSCSGTNSYRYGTMKENVISLTVVLADGTIIKTKNRPRKSSAGYNLTGLFVGSEGTLGIVVEATLKLHVRPQNEIVAIANFREIQDAAQTVADIVRAGVQANAIEFMDSRQMKVVNAAGLTNRTWAEDHLLIFKIGGSPGTLKDNTAAIRAIAKKNNGFNLEVAGDSDKDELWSARRAALWSSVAWSKSLNPDMQFWPTDVAVPLSKLPQVLTETAADVENSGLNLNIVAHLGDANFHASVIFPPEKYALAEELVNRITARAIANEGTVSGEHGVGIGKREFLVQELGEDTIDTMRKLKMALDPFRLLNPDKIFKIDPTENRKH
ncbi:hypothetical protein BABINDRAFT_160104 [Babjeviella inositovora NRRL Y-12698]|uniref:D-lactate dehydrogenase (cytochrome) n=1 Tax=Babjeviella inositovora NRRL Y-12698 TaxID=984486 RepID=A0A1E3QWH6_9ASCO|nr:uncharacterized protein BABINDRAFT_160104 [Babjeviella inositovora NRRL Y-12698]ODQ81874.1 hypothetical protein BABINDRAFT_160104 [Babjeviella inositovora NRRL Y-12698]